ncbi:S9 family peptidase [Roseateles albus]|uniref:Prolyl oligopeptidase family serine peptidase n=1 Tax=Roseateles albus TaxID=2987525 RepID=A0ABT5KGK6_9BURK|nr:alpha/beta fold hydrolase [Roseateles albus]MDC8773033.1 prolyl oligopeptidase family serine peptidase [Roseateles albus]
MTARAASPGAPESETPLIARTALFGSPERSEAQLSPNGKWLSWLAPVDGVMNIWLAPSHRPAAAKPVTSSKGQDIPSYFWSSDSQHLMFFQDQAGDENLHLYGIELGTGRQRDYTPFSQVRARLLGRSSAHPHELVLGLNQRDPRWHDVYRLDLRSGALRLLMRADGYANFLVDHDLQIRLAQRPNAAGGSDYFRVSQAQVAQAPYLSTTLEDSATAPLGYTHDGRTLYWTDSRGRDTTAVFAEDVASGRQRLLAEDARVDLRETMLDPRNGKIQAYAVNYLNLEWKFFDKAMQTDFAWLQNRLGKGEVFVPSRTHADDQWIVGIEPISKVGTTYLFDRKARQLTPLYPTRAALLNAPLVAMHGVEIKARDGLILPSYLSLPKSADRDGDGKADQPVPLVLLVHGGPWSRESMTYDERHQWLANRGYAVLSVNYRASSGFGKKFLNAGNLQWTKAMHTDLLDAKDWAVKQGITRPDTVAIMGASYGGYASLVGLSFTPTSFACGVDIVGPSNLETLLATIPPYWEARKQQFYKRMGDPTTEEGRATLRAASPVYKADQIARPLLIGQGANDPRVKQAESDQIVLAMQAKKIPVTYVLYPDEGHGFNKPNNRIGFNAMAEAFLGQCLGGRVEPLGETVRQSTAHIVTGAEHVPGLQAAAIK